LNHVSESFGGVAGVYNLHGYEIERAEAMEAWARHVLAIVDGEPPQHREPENVIIPMRGRV
jgi:hypothetical protein